LPTPGPWREGERLDALVKLARDEIWQAAMALPDWGSGERYRL
jgi:hypothetical protein